MLSFRTIFASIALLIAATSAALAESRIALVIGNSAYRSVSVLPNPANDAKAVADLLGTAGFEVVRVMDQTQSDMRRTVRDFTAKVAEKGPDTVALVYYAGHGLQVDGENFLVPVDARVERESDVAIETMRLADIMSALAAVPSRARIVILDACRNNPFSALNTGGKGLAIVDAPAGSIVAYSTAPGTEALDGAGSNSPYTAAFVKAAREPNVPIEQIFKRVRLLVHEATDSQQTPWESSSLTGDFTFFSGASAVADASAQAPVRAASWRDEIRTRSPREAYELVVMEDSIDAYEEYVILYPSNPWAERIRRLLALRAEASAWRYAVLLNTPEAYASYLAKFPHGHHAHEARRLQERPRVRPIDPVFRPRQVVAPRPLRVTLPLFPANIKPGNVRPSVTMPVKQTVIETPTKKPVIGLPPKQTTIGTPMKRAGGETPTQKGQATSGSRPIVIDTPRPMIRKDLPVKPKLTRSEEKRPIRMRVPTQVQPQGRSGCFSKDGRLVCPRELRQ